MPDFSKYSQRDEAICRFVARYIAVPYAVVNRVFFAGHSCGLAVQKLASPRSTHETDAPMLKRHPKALGTGTRRHSYVQLSAAGCRRFGLSDKRSQGFGTAALDLHLAIAWFCVLGGCARHRVSRDELLPHLGSQTPRANVPHVLTTESGAPAVLRVYHAVASPVACIRHLEAMLAELNRRPALSNWLADRDYGVAVLAPTPNAVAAIERAIAKSGIASDVLLVCDLGPTAETISQCLEQGRRP